jgi:hypothetical protein
VKSRLLRTRAVLVLLGIGLALSGLAVYADWGRDFESFYTSAQALAAGADPYEAVFGGATNINLPHVTALLLPLTFVPFDWAFGIWQIIQLLAWGALLSLLLGSGTRVPTGEFVAAATLFPGTLAQIALGQWGFLVAALVGMAWTASRRQSYLRAAVLIGVATSLKPFVGLLALALLRRRQFRSAAVAFGVMGGILTAGMLLLGPALYLRWFEAAQNVTWAAYPLNASLQGLVARSVPDTFAVPFLIVATLIVMGIPLLLCHSGTDENTSWTLVLVAALLVSPLGWLYYGWILTPGLLALPRWSRILKAGMACLWIPPGAVPAAWSLASVGLLLVWLALVLELRSSNGRPLEEN